VRRVLVFPDDGEATVKSLWSGLLTTLVVTAIAGLSPAAEPSENAIWYSIVGDDGAQIGFASQEIVPKPDGREIVDSQEIDVGEQRGATIHMKWRTVLTEDKAGRGISISSVSQVGRDSSRIDARIAGDTAEITRETPSERRTSVVALPPSVRFDNGDDLLRNWDPAVAPRLAFDNFNVDAMAVEHVTIERVRDAAPDAQGRIAVVRKRYEGNELRAVARLLVDRDGRIAEATLPMFGTGIVIKAVDRAAALQSHSPYRVFPNVIMKSPFRIPSPAALGHIRYRFGFRDGLEFEIPQTGEQRVTVEPGAATVDICDGCGPGLPSDQATLADALRPTAWLQSDAARIKEIAEPVARLPISDAAKMQMLLRKAKPYLGKVDFVGHFSALETLSRRSADCTEAAVLLAALGRAAGIPTRVANGVVYSRVKYHGVSNAFMPHSWTLAWADGKWRSFDLALDTFDATHVALTVGDGDERSLLAGRQLAGLLRWDSMAEVRTPAAN